MTGYEGVRPKIAKDRDRDCLAMIGTGTMSCDLPRGHGGAWHYDAEYQAEFTEDGRMRFAGTAR